MVAVKLPDIMSGSIIIIIIIIQELHIRRQIYAYMNFSCSLNFIDKSFHASSSLFLNESIDLASTISFGSSFQVLIVRK